MFRASRRRAGAGRRCPRTDRPVQDGSPKGGSRSSASRGGSPVSGVTADERGQAARERGRAAGPRGGSPEARIRPPSPMAEPRARGGSPVPGMATEEQRRPASERGSPSGPGTDHQGPGQTAKSHGADQVPWRSPRPMAEHETRGGARDPGADRRCPRRAPGIRGAAASRDPRGRCQRPEGRAPRSKRRPRQAGSRGPGAGRRWGPVPVVGHTGGPSPQGRCPQVPVGDGANG